MIWLKKNTLKSDIFCKLTAFGILKLTTVCKIKIFVITEPQ